MPRTQQDLEPKKSYPKSKTPTVPSTVHPIGESHPDVPLLTPPSLLPSEGTNGRTPSLRNNLLT